MMAILLMALSSGSVLVRVSIAVMKHHDPKQVGEERAYLAYTSTSLFIIERSQDRNSSRAESWRQELMQKPWRGASYWLVPYGLLSLFSHRSRTTSPGMAPLIMDRALSHQLLIKNMPYRPVYSPILCGHCLN